MFSHLAVLPITYSISVVKIFEKVIFCQIDISKNIWGVSFKKKCIFGSYLNKLNKAFIGFDLLLKLRIYQTSVLLPNQFISSKNCIETKEKLWHMHARKSKTITSLHSFELKSGLLFRLSGNGLLRKEFPPFHWKRIVINTLSIVKAYSKRKLNRKNVVRICTGNSCFRLGISGFP